MGKPLHIFSETGHQSNRQGAAGLAASWTFQVLRGGQTGPEIEVDSAQREGFGRMISVVCLMREARGTSAGRAIRGWLTPWSPRVAAMFKALDGEVEMTCPQLISR